MYQRIWSEEKDDAGVMSLVPKDLVVPIYPIGSIVEFFSGNSPVEGFVVGYSVVCIEDKHPIMEVVYIVELEEGVTTKVNEEDITHYIYPESSLEE